MYLRYVDLFLQFVLHAAYNFSLFTRKRRDSRQKHITWIPTLQGAVTSLPISCLIYLKNVNNTTQAAKLSKCLPRKYPLSLSLCWIEFLKHIRARVSEVRLRLTPGVSNIYYSDGAYKETSTSPFELSLDFHAILVSVTLATWALKSEIQLPSLQSLSLVFNKLALFVLYNLIIGLPATKCFIHLGHEFVQFASLPDSSIFKAKLELEFPTSPFKELIQNPLVLSLVRFYPLPVAY